MKRPKRFVPIALTLLMTFAAPLPGYASGAPKWTPEQLAAFADVVVIARVEALASGWDESAGSIYTYVTIAIEDVLRGTVSRPRIVLKQLGGRVGGIGLHVSDQADFRVGETALLFLEVRPRDGTLYTSALWQGKWTVGRDERDEPFVARQEPSADGAGRIEQRSMSAVQRSIARAPQHAAESRAIEFVPIGSQMAPAGTAFSSTHAFTLLGPLRYMFSPPVDMQAGGQPGLSGGGVAQVVAAIEKWNNAGALFRYGLGDPHAAPRCTTEELGNGRVTISFMDPCNEMSDTGGTLAIGGSYYFFGGAGTVDGTEFHRASEGFIVTNDGPTALQYLTTPGCFEDVQTHELGHVLGLGHSADPSAIMFPTINVNCAAGPRTLGEDDIAGITYIYGFRTSARATAPLTSPGDVQVMVNGTTSLTISWSPVTALTAPEAAAATTYRLDFRAGHDDGGPVLASFTTTSTVVTIAIPPGVSGAFNVIVTPANADGGGPPSPRRDFTICGVPPSPVTSLGATLVDGRVRVSWQAAPGMVFDIQAGSTQGAADIHPLTPVGSVTAIEAAVGPGFRAWIRVIARNGCGVAAPSDVFVH